MRELVDHHTVLADIRVPGIVVDYVVKCDDPADHAMTFGEPFNPAYLTSWRGERFSPEVSAALPGPVPQPSQNGVDSDTESAAIAGSQASAAAEPSLDARTIVQRRAVLELARRAPRVVNLGVGMPAAVGDLAHQAGLSGFTLTVEAGPVGGIPADGLSFGASAYPEAVIDQPAQFDFYEGGGIDLAILGLAELDGEGNVNVSKFGEGEHALIAGVGGFINITQSAKAVVFMGTLTAGGLKVAVQAGQLHIAQEGRLQKIVPRVSHLSFNGRYVAGLGTDVLYITERAVFAMQPDAAGLPRLTLTEVAPGLDVQRDVLMHCGTPVAISPTLRTMDARVFQAGAFQLG